MNEKTRKLAEEVMMDIGMKASTELTGTEILEYFSAIIMTCMNYSLSGFESLEMKKDYVEDLNRQIDKLLKENHNG